MRRVLLAVLLVLAVPACGGGSGTDQGSDSGGGSIQGDGEREFDRCTLITAEEAEQWLGSPVDHVGPADLPVDADATCNYQSTANEKIILFQVNDGERYFASEGSGARGPDTITGIGEDAHTDGTYVEFLSDGYAVRVSRIQGDIPLADLEEIALLLESRLP